MQKREEIFHARLEQLEAGADLVKCLDGLNAEDAAALQLIATVRAAAFPAQDGEVVTAYRARVLQKAAQRGKMGAVRQPERDKPRFSLGLERVREQLDWLLTRRVLAGVMVALFVGACLLISGLITLQLAGNGNSQPLAGIGGDSEAGKTPEATDSSGDSPLQESDVPRETIAAASSHEIFVPVMSHPVVANPTTAVIQGVRGRVEIQLSDGTWTPIFQTGPLAAGQRIRTGDLSSAIVAYFDGSQAIVGANSELALDELDAQLPENGFRTVVMTQVTGESEHHVAFRNDGGSRYEVKTAAGNGVARGTIFHVLVTPDLRARFTVNEGQVDVSNLSNTVAVLAGQMTQAMAGRAPESPAFRISGEGEVSQMGATWIIAGQSFQTDNNTIMIGSPQMGDLVHVEGHLTPDGVRLADRIILLQPSANNQFSLTGEVDEIAAAAWVIAGQTLVVNADTQIEEGIVVGDVVRVEGQILPGGTLLAGQIFRLDGQNGFPFQFSGVVQQMGEATWVISGQAVAVDEQTAIDEGIEVDDVVTVRGRVLPNGSWLARSIRLVPQPIPEFALTGLVQGIDPWSVASVPFETRDWTVIEPGIAVGDLVRVRGIILNDGTWVAVRIESLENPPLNVIVLIGIVTGIDPWSINGVPVIIGGGVMIGSGINIGQLVIIHIQLPLNGPWVVLNIQPLRPLFGLGCLTITAVVIRVSGNQIILQNWDPLVLDDDMEVQGNIQPNSIILFPLCTWPNGTVIIINIIVIYQPVIIVVPPTGNPGGPGGGGGNDNGNDND